MLCNDTIVILKGLILNTQREGRKVFNFHNMQIAPILKKRPKGKLLSFPLGLCIFTSLHLF